MLLYRVLNISGVIELPFHINENDRTDVQLIEEMRAGDQSAFEVLLQRFSPLIKSYAYKYNIFSADNDDYIQEGFIALMSAVNSYSTDKNIPFSAYASQCVRNRLIDVNRHYSSNKGRTLNDYAELDEISEADIFDIDATNPERIFIERERAYDLYKSVRSTFSPLEYQVFVERLNGKHYSEIAQKCNISCKAVDNAVQRIRKKLMKVCDNNA